MKIALVHDYLREYGGAERVLEALHEMYPDAPVYTAFVDKNALGIHWTRFQDWQLKETWITKLPLYKKLYSPYRIFAPKAFESLDFSKYDVVISSSNAYFAKAISVPHGVHICYCHTPPRALYGYTTLSDWKQNPFTRIIGTIMNHYLRIEDFKMAQKVDYFIANSAETARRIKKFYRRDSTVIFPPVQIPDQSPVTESNSKTTEKYFLYVNRLALAKHPEIAVAACTKQKLRLKVVGEGKMLEQLKSMAGPTVEFLGAVSDKKLHELYEGAAALLYPVEDEDFGIVPVEAMGHGVPVIAHDSGGPRETVIHKKTGILFADLSVKGLTDAITEFSSVHFRSSDIYRHAQQFATARFQQKIQKLVATVSKKK